MARNATTFKKGERPVGRKKGTINKVSFEIRKACQDEGARLFKRMLKLTNSKDDRVALAAIRELWDRGYGKPIQSMTVIRRDDATELSDQELENIARAGGNGAADPESGEEEVSTVH